MKLQISDQQWRLRVSEDELQRLRGGHALVSASTLPGDAVLRFVLELVPTSQASVGRDGDSWKFSLPAASVDAYVERLPCRDGVDFVLPGGSDVALQLAFEVDVRDSVRRRGARPRRH
ncbi:MAG: hypothetical protein EPN69_07720 [Rhodanobacter sp.]|nr:MAG: hypothetical protein EPN69_07720 [Rhodanobacter sp.]TAM07365.1 MAG: hypothetical protein EPN71_00105 [Rhodanobacter sp.]TAM38452.1 MAG: hypothetical protein EPN58_16730 [Rhodanobacter sp.]TAN27018.1 MAG: hypothetical protein EPN32_04845 [Rhodanobacter sp.]